MNGLISGPNSMLNSNSLIISGAGAGTASSRFSMPNFVDGSKCYGPLKSLQYMVPNKWWETLFADDWYLRTDGDVVEDEQVTKEEVDSLLKDVQGLEEELSQGKDIKILDLCCGQGRHSIELKKRFPALRIHGHDQSKFLINLAKERSSTFNDENISFSVGDSRKVPLANQSVDTILLMGNSFGYFDTNTEENEEEAHGDLTVLKEAYRLLAPGGKLVLDITNGAYVKKNFAPRSWEWIDQEHFVVRERELYPAGSSQSSTSSESSTGSVLISREIINNIKHGVVRDQFYRERLYELSELKSLLLNNAEDGGAGFQSVSLLGDVDLGSVCKEFGKRGQDLGMMESRLMVVATKAK